MQGIDWEYLENRKAVWIALSDLFLDTDVSLSYDYISRVCAESRYSLDELKNILECEVAPVCSRNLLSIAGEWAGFDEDWLVNSIQKNLQTRHFLPKCLLSYLRNIAFKGYIKMHWQILEAKIIARRSQV